MNIEKQNVLKDGNIWTEPFRYNSNVIVFMFYWEKIFFTYIPRFKIVHECSADPNRAVVLHESDRSVSPHTSFRLKTRFARVTNYRELFSFLAVPELFWRPS